MEKRLWLVLLIGLLGGCLGGMLTMRLANKTGEYAEMEVLRARRFELIDGAGRRIATWGVESDQHALLSFVDEAGRRRVELGVSLKPLSQQLAFRDADGRIRVGLVTGSDGKSGLNMGDEARLSRILLGYIPDDTQTSDSSAWGLVLPKMGALSSWASIGVLRDPVTGAEAGHVSVLDSSGKRWSEPK